MRPITSRITHQMTLFHGMLPTLAYFGSQITCGHCALPSIFFFRLDETRRLLTVSKSGGRIDESGTGLCLNAALSRGSGTVGTIKRLMLCEEKDRLLDACVTATDRQAEAVKTLSAIAAKDNRAACGEARAHAEQTRQDAEQARLALHLHSETHGC